MFEIEVRERGVVIDRFSLASAGAFEPINVGMLSLGVVGRNLFGASVHPSYPVLIRGAALPSTWSALPVPCTLRAGGIELAVKVRARGFVEQWKRASPLVRFGGLIGPILAIAFLCGPSRVRAAPPVTAPAPVAAPVDVVRVAPVLAPPRPARAAGPTPAPRDPRAEQRAVQAMLARDYPGALSEYEALAAAHPDVREYAQIARVLRAKVRRER